MTRLLSAILLAGLCLGSSLPTLKYRALSSAGVPLSGAKLYFYETGTTTPLATYSDEALTSANANPVVSDAYGWFGEIYLKTDQAYRVVLKTSAGVTQWTLDSIWASQLTSNAFQTRIKQIASNPLDYGAVGDGVADEDSHVQSAITNATEVVDLLGKTYRCDNTLTVPSNRVIRNGTLDFTNSAENSYITLTGTIGNPVALTLNVAAGDLAMLPASMSGLATDDWIYVESSEAWSSTGAATSGEVFQLVAVSADTIYLDHPTLLSYTAATAAGVHEITPVDNVTFENVKIMSSMVASGTGNIISASKVTNLRIRDMVVDGVKGSVVLASLTARLDIDNLTTVGGADTTSYGLRLQDAVWMASMRNSRLTSLEYGVKTDVVTAGNDGLIIGVNVESTRFDDVDQPVYISAEAWDVHIIDNLITNTPPASGNAAMSLRSGLMEISGNTIMDGADEGLQVIYAVGTDVDWSSIVISDNAIYDAGGFGIYVAATGSAAATLDNLDISGNKIISSGNDAIQLNTYLNDRIAISGNTMTDAAAGGIIIQSGAEDAITLVIDNNDMVLTDAGEAGISVNSTDGGGWPCPRITNNRITGTFGAGIYLGSDITPSEGVSAAFIDGNRVDGDALASATLGIYLDTINGPSITITNNDIDDIDGAGGKAISVVNGANVTTTPVLLVSNNRADGAVSGISIAATSEAFSSAVFSGNVVTGTTGASAYTLAITGYASEIAITGNTLTRTDDLSHNLFLSGAAAAAITNVNITGNVFENGDYAVGEGTDANSTNIIVADNQMVGLSTFGSEYGVNLRGNTPNAVGTYFFQAAASGDVTGPTDGSDDNVVFGVEGSDFGGIHNHTTGTFTAPVAGIYLLSASVILESEANENIDDGFVRFETSAGSCLETTDRFGGTQDNPTDNLEDVFTKAQVCLLAAGETVNVSVYCGGAGADCTINIGSSFTGILLQ